MTPPEAVRARLHAYAASLGRPELRVLPAENLHVTVLFLGAVPDDEVERLATAVAGAAAAEPPFALGVPYVTPGPPRRPTMLWGEVSGGEPLLRLSRAMHGLAAPFAPGRAKPQRIPHVTLARARSPLHGLDRQPVEPDPPTFEVQQVELVRSRLSPRGARYETVAALPLHWPA